MFFVLLELCSETMITHSVCRPSMYECSMLYPAKLITVSTYSDVFPWDLDINPWVESHMWPQQMWGQRSSRGNDISSKFLKKRVTVSILWCIFMGLGHNDPWVESHMWPQAQQLGVQGHLGVNDLWFKFLKKKRVTIFTYFDVMPWKLETMILG